MHRVKKSQGRHEQTHKFGCRWMRMKCLLLYSVRADTNVRYKPIFSNIFDLSEHVSENDWNFVSIVIYFSSEKRFSKCLLQTERSCFFVSGLNAFGFFPLRRYMFHFVFFTFHLLCVELLYYVMFTVCGIHMNGVLLKIHSLLTRSIIHQSNAQDMLLNWILFCKWPLRVFAVAFLLFNPIWSHSLDVNLWFPKEGWTQKKAYDQVTKAEKKSKWKDNWFCTAQSAENDISVEKEAALRDFACKANIIGNWWIGNWDFESTQTITYGRRDACNVHEKHVHAWRMYNTFVSVCSCVIVTLFQWNQKQNHWLLFARENISISVVCIHKHARTSTYTRARRGQRDAHISNEFNKY